MKKMIKHLIGVFLLPFVFTALILAIIRIFVEFTWSMQTDIFNKIMLRIDKFFNALKPKEDE